MSSVTRHQVGSRNPATPFYRTCSSARVYGPKVTVVQKCKRAAASEPIQPAESQRQPLWVLRCRRTTIVAGAASVPGICGRGRSVFQAAKGRGSRRPARRAPLAGRGGPDCVRPGVDDPAERLHPPREIWTLGDGQALLNERTRRRDCPAPGTRIKGASSRPCDARSLSWRVRNRSCIVVTTQRSPEIRPAGCTHPTGSIRAWGRGGNRDAPRVGRNARGSASS